MGKNQYVKIFLLSTTKMKAVYDEKKYFLTLVHKKFLKRKFWYLALNLEIK